MEKQQKPLVTLTFFLALIAIVATVVSLATDNWVESEPKLRENGSDSSRFSEANFGLFKGYRSLDYGSSARPANLNIHCESSQGVCVYYPDKDFNKDFPDGKTYIEHVMSNRTGQELYQLGLFSYGLYVVTILSAVFSIVFGLIAMGFAIFNICGKPIETITGPTGLYIWNGMAFIFSILEMTIFLVLFTTTLQKNFIVDELWTRFLIEDYTDLGFSFYLVPASSALYLINIILLFASGYKIKCSFSDEAEKVVDNAC